MISEDRAEKLDNLLLNHSGIMMAAMGMMVGDVMGRLAEAIGEIFKPASPGAGERSAEDVAAQIRKSVPAEMLEMFAEPGDVKIDEEKRAAMMAKLSDEGVDELFAMVEEYDCGLPKFTAKLAPESLLGYFYLMQDDERLQKMFQDVMEWMEAKLSD